MRLQLDGCWYVDALASGDWAALVAGSRIRTSRGDVPLPPGGNLLYLRCAVIKTFLCLVGQGHDDGNAWLWVDRWYALSDTHGTSPCAFGPEGTVYVSTPQATDNVRVFDARTRQLVRLLTRQIGSRGIAHVDADGVPRSVDAWYGRDGFAEYTDLTSLRVGQGAEGGLVVRERFLTGAPLRVLEPGDVQFIRGDQVGQSIATAAWKPKERGAVIHFLTMPEIVALPLVTAPPPPPPPEKDPPMPDVKWPLAPNMKSTVEQVIREHQEIILTTDKTRQAILPHIVKRLNKPGERTPWGMKAEKKPKHPLDSTGEYNTDAINFLRPDGLMELIDVITNGKAAWGRAKSKTPTKQGVNGWWMPSPEPGDDDEPEPPDEDEPDDDTVADLLARVKALEATAIRSGSRIALQTQNGSYLCAEGGGGGDVNATRTSVGGWETLTVSRKQ